jgi:hypothetical protein
MHRHDGRPSGRDPDSMPPVNRRSAPSDVSSRATVESPTDEAEADAARRRLRKEGIIAIEPDCQVRGLLDADELLVAIRPAVDLDRRQPGPLERHGRPGDLYVTTRRLLHLGGETVTYDLGRIREAVIAGDELMLMLDDGQGVAISTSHPNLLRVEIAAARAAARAAHRATAVAGGREAELES